PQQARIGRARFDSHPADRLLAEVRNEPGGGTGPRVTAVSLLAEAAAPFLVAQRTPVAVQRLEPLTVALARVAGGAEDRLQVCPRGVVRGDDRPRDRLSRLGAERCPSDPPRQAHRPTPG